MAKDINTQYSLIPLIRLKRNTRQETIRGNRNILLIDPQPAFLHGKTGPIPIKKTNKSINGPFTLLKNGCPIVMVVSSTASDNIGNIVPHRVINAISKKSIFWAKKADSLEIIESNPERLFKVSNLKMNITREMNRVTAITARKTHPMVDSAKECTDGTGPPRLMNMPI
jgi:hypothetical protein